MSDPAVQAQPTGATIKIRIARRRADFATIFGLVFAIGLIVAALAMGGPLMAFVDVPSILIVVGGTLAVTTISFTPQELFGAVKVIGNSLFRREINPSMTARQLLDLAVAARTEGVLSLQRSEQELAKDSFLHRGYQMLIDGNKADEITRIMGQEIDASMSRHQKGVNILRRASEAAPAMGLIGTLIGLVQMLSMLDDPKAIGPSMAVALITTFYGAILGTVILAPMAAKLELNSEAEALDKTLIVSGFSSIARQEHPRQLELILNSELPPSQRIKYFD